MTEYKVWDEFGSKELIEEYTKLEAAQVYVSEGDFGDSTETVFHEIYVSEGDSIDSYTIQVDPDSPPCKNSNEHEWVEESVRGSGGGVIIVEKCKDCSVLMHTDTWAQNRNTGEQGYTTISYSREEY